MAYPPEILQQPMRRVCARLSSLGVDLASFNALEFFAREGNWHTLSYAPCVATLDAWEIDPDCEAALRHNLPNARVRIGNSFEFSRLPEFRAQFDLIVYDNPQVTFGAKGQYCEHFEALETLPILMKPRAVTIFNINREPFDYDSFPDWQRRRRAFYHCAESSYLADPFFKSFYADYFHKLNILVEDVFIQTRHEHQLAYFVAILQKLRIAER